MHKRITAIILAILILGIGVYAVWYTLHRQAVIAQTQQCEDRLAHPESAPNMRAPDGTMVPVMGPCTLGVTPPSFFDLVTGHVAFTDVPNRMKVNPYTFFDVLLGRYTMSPNIELPCDQSATTTDCSKLPIPQQASQPYVPPNPVQPTQTWTSATGTSISLYGFTFELPAGWRGEVYKSAYTGDVYVLAQNDSNDRGFTIDCPPNGKGLEAATRLTSEERSYSADGIHYTVALEKWTSPGNNPWYFLWIKSSATSTDTTGTYCLAQGTAVPDIGQAMQVMYDSWK